MNRTETNEEAEWRNASHPRLVERLDNQRKEITRLNAERDAAIARADKLTQEALLHNAMLKGANDHALDMKERAEKAETSAQRANIEKNHAEGRCAELQAIVDGEKNECGGDPDNCPENEGYGCACSAKSAKGGAL